MVGHGAKTPLPTLTKRVSLQLDSCPCRGLGDILLGLMESAFQRLGLGHITNGCEMRGNRIRAPVSFGEIETFTFEI